MIHACSTTAYLSPAKLTSVCTHFFFFFFPPQLRYRGRITASGPSTLSVLAAITPDHAAAIDKNGVIFTASLSPATSECAAAAAATAAVSTTRNASASVSGYCEVIEAVGSGVVAARDAVVGVQLDFTLNPATSPFITPGVYTIKVTAALAPSPVGAGARAGAASEALPSEADGILGVPTFHNITKYDTSTPALTVEVDAQRRIVQNGKPHFPIGMYVRRC